jgi:hypothetical protein
MYIAGWFARVKPKKGAELGLLYKCHHYFIARKRMETVASANLSSISVCHPRKTL